MSGELAGLLRHRMTVERRDDARDALGGAAGGWKVVASVWAGLAADGIGAVAAAEARDAAPRFRVTMRADADVTVGDRLIWGARALTVRAVVADPMLPDRIVVRAEEER